ncbi:MAG: hypothetical protein U5N58_04850 [Actinomycetota bacterium]|nr:hypothetical protein [Actinomycetota bacterium]
MMKLKSLISISVIVILAVTLSFAGCAQEAEPEETVAETATGEEAFTVGFSNGIITHSWRTQMTGATWYRKLKYYKGAGWQTTIISTQALM